MNLGDEEGRAIASATCAGSQGPASPRAHYTTQRPPQDGHLGVFSWFFFLSGMALIVLGLNMMRPSLDILESAGEGLAPGLATPSKMRKGGVGIGSGSDGTPPKPQEQREIVREIVR